MKIAREKFSSLNEGILDDQREYIRVDWIKKSCDMLEHFNELVCIFKKINYQCDTYSYGYHDIDEFYKE